MSVYLIFTNDIQMLHKNILTFCNYFISVIDKYASKPFLPISFEEAIHGGHFNKDIPIVAGFTSEEGLIFSAPFHKSHKRWNVFFEQWDKWTPLMFFNRETDLISNEDAEVV
jgi:hypothetical protein